MSHVRWLSVDAATARRRKPGQDAKQFKTDEESGKMVIDNEDGGSEHHEQQRQHAEAINVEGTAYREGITSVDGFTRGPDGKVKFNKDTKKRRRDHADVDDDVEMAEADSAKPASKKQQKSNQKLGHEFKAKVSKHEHVQSESSTNAIYLQRAGGDAKKGDVDPYAYMSLSQAAKKGTKGGKRLGVVGKR